MAVFCFVILLGYPPLWWTVYSKFTLDVFLVTQGKDKFMAIKNKIHNFSFRL